MLLTILIQALEFPAADVTWLLHISKLWLAGGQYGKNFIEIDRRLAVLIGSLATLGVALKPHFLLLSCLLELTAMLRLKKPFYWWRPEIITILISLTIYLIIILQFLPSYNSIIISHYFKYYINYARQPTIRLLQTDSSYCMFADIFAYFLLYKKLHYFNLNLVLLSSTAAGFLIYFLEGQLWYYHAIPVTSYSFIFFSLILLSAHVIKMQQNIFFTQTAKTSGVYTDRIITDKEPALYQVIENTFGDYTDHRNNKFMNNRLEQDHRGIKSRYKPMKRFKDMFCAQIFCTVFEEVSQFFRMKNKTRAEKRGRLASRIYGLSQLLA